MRKDKLQPVILARALNPQPQIGRPEIELRNIMPRLGAQVHRIGALLRQLGIDEGLRVCDLRLERVAAGEVVVALGREGADGGVHLVFLGGFFGEGLLVGVGFDLEDLDVFLFHALVLYVLY